MTASQKKPRRERYTGEIKLDNARMEKVEKRIVVSTVDLRPYIEALKASRDSEQSVGYDVFEASVNVLRSRFRQAATKLGYGVSFQIITPNSEIAKERGYDLKKGDVRFIVTAGEKQVRTKPGEPSTPVEGAEGADQPAAEPSPEPALASA